MSIQSLVIFVSMHKKTLISFIGLDFLVQIWSLLVKKKNPTRWRHLQWQTSKQKCPEKTMSDVTMSLQSGCTLVSLLLSTYKCNWGCRYLTKNWTNQVDWSRQMKNYVFTIHLEEDINISAAYHGNPFNSCWDGASSNIKGSPKSVESIPRIYISVQYFMSIHLSEFRLNISVCQCWADGGLTQLLFNQLLSWTMFLMPKY